MTSFRDPVLLQAAAPYVQVPGSTVDAAHVFPLLLRAQPAASFSVVVDGAQDPLPHA